MKKKLIATILLLVSLLLAGCGNKQTAAGLQDGYYTAEASEYVHGWMEYVTICVRGGRIVTVEYNARNSSGFIKSWDMDYMRIMEMYAGNYPNRYTRDYAGQFLESQNPANVDGLAGATTSYVSFKLLAEAAIAQANAGDTQVAKVNIS